MKKSQVSRKNYNVPFCLILFFFLRAGRAFSPSTLKVDKFSETIGKKWIPPAALEWRSILYLQKSCLYCATKVWWWSGERVKESIRIRDTAFVMGYCTTHSLKINLKGDLRPSWLMGSLWHGWFPIDRAITFLVHLFCFPYALSQALFIYHSLSRKFLLDLLGCSFPRVIRTESLDFKKSEIV